MDGLSGTEVEGETWALTAVAAEANIKAEAKIVA
jgi:hypothetical protein